MHPVRLRAGHEWLTPEELGGSFIPEGLSDQERSVKEYCRLWLGGQQEFQFRTSGSTGSPRQITFQRSQLQRSAELTADALQLRSGMSALICLDTRFIAGAMMIVRSLVTGMSMIASAPRANPLDGEAGDIDFAALVPLQLTTLLDNERDKLNSIQTVIVGGAPIGQYTIDALEGLRTSVYATYGMTETITHVALQKLNGPDRADCFTLLPGIDAALDDRGCLVIRAAHLGNEPIVTNDVVAMVGRNKFRWKGRADQVINSGGVKVQPESVERAVAGILKEMVIQRRYFVIGIPDKKLGEQIALVLEGSSLTGTEEANLKTKLAERLEKFEMPRVVLYAHSFLETATQKTDRLGTLRTIVS